MEQHSFTRRRATRTEAAPAEDVPRPRPPKPSNSFALAAAALALTMLFALVGLYASGSGSARGSPFAARTPESMLLHSRIPSFIVLGALDSDLQIVRDLLREHPGLTLSGSAADNTLSSFEFAAADAAGNEGDGASQAAAAASISALAREFRPATAAQQQSRHPQQQQQHPRSVTHGHIAPASYLYHPLAPFRLRAVLPQADNGKLPQIVVLLRDPVQQLRARYVQRCATAGLNETRTLRRAVSQGQRLRSQLSECYSISMNAAHDETRVRACFARHLTDRALHSGLTSSELVEQGVHADALLRWFQAFGGRARFMVLTAEQLASEPQLTLAELLQHVRLPYFAAKNALPAASAAAANPFSPAMLASCQARLGALSSAAAKPTAADEDADDEDEDENDADPGLRLSDGALSEDLRLRLLELYRPHNQRLFELLGEELGYVRELTINPGFPLASYIFQRHADGPESPRYDRHRNLRIAYVLCVHGEGFPPHFNYLTTAAYASAYILDLLVLHEGAKLPERAPDNVRFINVGRGGFVARLRDALFKQSGLGLQGDHAAEIGAVLSQLLNRAPALLSAFRPATGALFADLLANYTHWAAGGADFLLGDLPSFVERAELRELDVVAYVPRPTAVVGAAATNAAGTAAAKTKSDSSAAAGQVELRLDGEGSLVLHANNERVNALWTACDLLHGGLSSTLSSWLRTAREHNIQSDSPRAAVDAFLARLAPPLPAVAACHSHGVLSKRGVLGRDSARVKLVTKALGETSLPAVLLGGRLFAAPNAGACNVVLSGRLGSAANECADRLRSCLRGGDSSSNNNALQAAGSTSKPPAVSLELPAPQPELTGVLEPAGPRAPFTPAPCGSNSDGGRGQGGGSDGARAHLCDPQPVSGPTAFFFVDGQWTRQPLRARGSIAASKGKPAAAAGASSGGRPNAAQQASAPAANAECETVVEAVLVSFPRAAQQWAAQQAAAAAEAAPVFTQGSHAFFAGWRSEYPHGNDVVVSREGCRPHNLAVTDPLMWA